MSGRNLVVIGASMGGVEALSAFQIVRQAIPDAELVLVTEADVAAGLREKGQLEGIQVLDSVPGRRISASFWWHHPEGLMAIF